MNVSPLMVLAQAPGESGGGMIAGLFGAFGSLISLAIFVLVVVGLWKVFEKAGEPGWASIIPIYNVIVLLKIVGRPWWWLILAMIPFVGFIIWIMVSMDVAKSFGKGVGYAIGLMILPMICYPLLGFSDAAYQGPAAG